MFLCLSPPVVREERDQEEAVNESPPPIIVDGEVYQVQEILDSPHRGRLLQYLIDWEGYGPEERSLVNAQDIQDPSLTAEFHRAHPQKPAPCSHGRPRCHVPPRFRSHSQGGGSVTNQASVALRSPPEGTLSWLLAFMYSHFPYLGLITGRNVSP